MKRMWINQPSTLQPYHALHGRKVLADMKDKEVVKIYFLSGKVISQQIHKIVLANGWN